MSRIALAVAAILAVVACGGSSATAPTRPDNVAGEAGVYALTLVPISGLVLFQDSLNGGTTSLLSGTAKINADMTYSVGLNFQTSVPGQPDSFSSTAEAGTFTLHNSALTMKPAGTAPSYQAAVGDGVLVYIEPTMQRQLKFVR